LKDGQFLLISIHQKFFSGQFETLKTKTRSKKFPFLKSSIGQKAFSLFGKTKIPEKIQFEIVH